MRPTKPFPDRFNLRQTAPIVTRQDAPADVRHGILTLVNQSGLKMYQVHRAVHKALLLPESSSAKEDHLLRQEIGNMVNSCRWYQVYQIVEEIYGVLQLKSTADAEHFSHDINALLKERGVGLELHRGVFEHRSDSELHEALTSAKALLSESKRSTALGELEEAFADIRRLPEPEVTGAIQHAIGALECLSRDLVGDEKMTLGKIVKHYPNLLPTTLATVVDKTYGFASDEARHLREGKQPDFAEAELVVGLSAVIISYLLRVENRKQTDH